MADTSRPNDTTNATITLLRSLHQVAQITLRHLTYHGHDSSTLAHTIRNLIAAIELEADQLAAVHLQD